MYGPAGCLPDWLGIWRQYSQNWLSNFCGIGPRPYYSAGFALLLSPSAATPLEPASGVALNSDFYRAVNAVVLYLSVCLSVCLSVTNRCSTETVKRRITQTTAHDNPETLVF